MPGDTPSTYAYPSFITKLIGNTITKNDITNSNVFITL